MPNILSGREGHAIGIICVVLLVLKVITMFLADGSLYGIKVQFHASGPIVLYVFMWWVGEGWSICMQTQYYKKIYYVNIAFIPL